MTQQRAASKTTIAAIATPPGRGGVAIVRVSGDKAQDILDKLFTPRVGAFSGFIPRHMHYGLVSDVRGRVLDEVLAVFMPGPHSYTGEDVAEIHCHGGSALVSLVLEAALELGAETAGPGEFTRRAFMNGRLDLSQAEAVAELIAAPNRAAAFMAKSRLAGSMGHKAGELRRELEQLRQGVALAVDFPEEDVDCLSREAFAQGVQEVLGQVSRLLGAYERTRTWREGALVVLCGRVNAGKSSLMNALLGRRRAIVADCPGTTRDYLEEQLQLGSLSLRLVDTAGLRDEGGKVEMEGIRLSRDLAESADLALVVVDGARLALDPGKGLSEERELVQAVGRERVLAVLNKIDLLEQEDLERAAKRCQELLGEEILLAPISAKGDLGLEELLAAVKATVIGRSPEPSATELTPNMRQSQSLARVRDDLADLLEDIGRDTPYDILGVLLESACAGLEEITGRIAPESVLNAIFQDFCIGK